MIKEGVQVQVGEVYVDAPKRMLCRIVDLSKEAVVECFFWSWNGSVGVEFFRREDFYRDMDGPVKEVIAVIKDDGGISVVKTRVEGQ